MKVLLVEDEPELRDIFKKMLSDYEVTAISDGKKAVELYGEIKPEIVLMDIVLEVGSGIEVAKEILKIDSNAKIIAVTAYARGNRKKILEAGILEILEKPFLRKELIDMIERFRK